MHLEYFVLKNTIEEGLILRMNIASQFIHKYIMPLAKFYDISINYQKYLEKNDDSLNSNSDSMDKTKTKQTKQKVSVIDI